MKDEKASKLAKKLGETKVSAVVIRQLMEIDRVNQVKIVDPQIAVVLTDRSEWGTSGGIGYFDQVRVYYHGQQKMQEWQWRDRYSESRDRPSLRVDSIGAVSVLEKDGKTVVEVELVNNKYGKRTATYTFDSMPQTATQTLSTNEQAAFATRAEKEVVRVMADLEKRWMNRPKMLNSYPTSASDRYVPYQRPSIKQRELRPEIGVAAFIIEEQIDHVYVNPQFRHELFVLTAESPNAKSEAEDHGFDYEGGAFLSILEVTREHIIINTKGGKKTIQIQ